MVLRTTGDLSSVPYTPRLIPARARAWFYWAVVLSLVAAPLAYAGGNTLGCGRELREEYGQCVGLSDDLDQLDPDSLVRGVLKAINDENADIPPDAPTATVFYLGPLTKDKDPTSKSGDQLNGVLGELVGLHTRQREYNDQKSYWRVRVEFANVGQDFRSASYAAQMVEERAKGDRGAAAVIGLAWSRKETQEAIKILGRAQLPMLSTTNTADATPKVNGNLNSPYFFRMAAPNSAQAKAMVRWIEHGLSDGGPGISPAKVAILEQWDPYGRDIYSEDLTRELRIALPELPEALPFFEKQKNSPDEFQDLSDEQKELLDDQKDLLEQVRVACEVNKAEVLVYTGRTTFLDVLGDYVRNKCNPSVQILAGDEVTVTMAGAAKWSRPQMNFVSLTNVLQQSNEEDDSIGLAVQGLPMEAASVISLVHAHLAYDALWAVTYALNELSRQQTPETVKSDLDVAAGVHYNLRGLSPINGTSGWFSFESGSTDHTATPRTLWLFSAGAGQIEKVQKRGECTVTPQKVDCRYMDQLPAK